MQRSVQPVVATLVSVPECTNCTRFLASLGEIQQKLVAEGMAAPRVNVVNYRALQPQQRVGITVVPTLILRDGRKLEATGAFAWLESYSQMLNPSGFGEFDGLPCCSVNGCTTYYGEDRRAPSTDEPVLPYRA